MASPKAGSEVAEGTEGTVEGTVTDETAANGNPDPASAEEAAKQAEEESARERKAREKAEAEALARKAKLDAGDLIVTDSYEFEANSKETKTSEQVARIIEAIKAADAPVVFADTCKEAGAKYPEDILPALLSLEYLGMVRRFDTKRLGDESQRRRSTAFLWIADK